LGYSFPFRYFWGNLGQRIFKGTPGQGIISFPGLGLPGLFGSFPFKREIWARVPREGLPRLN